ncbi:MAG: 2-C-methyl-D-erythritol 2,4-cyclodiphosphate synthase [Oscillospiraceae bacterium]|jgi:2-C-methyl-D-erythritol 2,4-cyclodiphosphate synthase|nr:2-C-methyl-D-erythritol 2,4-cyclodiphosphate synthase [Oscillospiraceae bacterium]
MSGKIRIGYGYDAHRLVYDRRMILCGVQIDYERGLLGHSDADVPVHALIDALLGAAALGDIGQMFPDNDPRYKNADSIELLKSAYACITAQGYRLSNADITIVAQAPKLAPYITAMRETLAAALRVPVGDISVKAKTEEKMGFTGSGEGISAHAAVLLER